MVRSIDTTCLPALFRMRHRRHTVGTQMLNNGMSLIDVMTYLDHRSRSMTLSYGQIYDDTLKNKFKELVRSGQATGGIALAAFKEQLDQGDESELDWVVSNLRLGFRCRGVTVFITRRRRSALTGRMPASPKTMVRVTSW
jgi:hypothetical protein